MSRHPNKRKDPTMKTILTITAISLTAFTFSARAADPKTNWANNCAQCHGADGSANTKMGKMLNAKDLTDPKVQAEFTDAKATQSIKDGVKQGGKTTMKAFAGKLSDDEIKALVAYVRKLKK
jgi:mono/diheme cytochrome c family protein